MTDHTLRPILQGKKALVIGIANDSSIAYGCAKAFRELDADLAITYLNDKARPYVEPLAREMNAALFLPLARGILDLRRFIRLLLGDDELLQSAT